MIVRLVLLIILALGATSAHAQDAAPGEPARFYVFSFSDTPAVEAAQDVVVGALAYELEIDAAAEGVVSFRADGEYSPDALLRDFGDALLDQDLALMRTNDDAYALIPRANMPLALQRGGVLMATTGPALASSPRTGTAGGATTPIVYGRDRWWDGAVGALLLFLAGGVAGAAALLGGQVVHRRAEAGRLRLAPPLLRLTDQSDRGALAAETEAVADPDLVIPRFRGRNGA